MAFVVHGGYVHTPTRGGWECVEEALVHVDAHGWISCIEDRHQMGAVAFAAALAAARSISAEASFRALPRGGFLLPGFVDCHVHAPQYAAAGTGLDLPLMQWLERYTFPSEARMADPARAEQMYGAAVGATLRAGTTTACYFGTIHAEATLILAEKAASAGQRAMVGLVSMDRNAPDDYKLTTEGCVAELESVLQAFCGPSPRFPAGGLVQVRCPAPRLPSPPYPSMVMLTVMR
jgi:guanine deaminase